MKGFENQDVKVTRGLFHPLAGQMGGEGQNITTLFTGFVNVDLEKYVPEFTPRAQSWWVLYALSEHILCYFEGLANQLDFDRLFLFDTKAHKKVEVSLPCPMRLFKYNTDSVIATDGKTILKICLSVQKSTIAYENTHFLVILEAHLYKMDFFTFLKKTGKELFELIYCPKILSLKL